jgi:hypothetical protein
MPRAWPRLIFALGLTGAATIAGAQSKKPAPLAVPGSPASAAGNKDGPPRGRRAPAARARPEVAVATFPGFRLLPDGSSRIYVEVTRQVTVAERRAEGMLIYVLHDTRVPVRNNRNPLITTHFATPVGRARLLAAGADVELLIDLRKNTSAAHKMVPGENGGARLEVDFPAGDYPPAPGLFEPAAKGRARDADPPETTEAVPAQGAAPPSASGNNGRAASTPGDVARTAPSAASSSPPPAR